MRMLAIELLGAVAILVIVALVARVAWVARDRKQLRAAITEAQARANAAPLTTAILASKRGSGAQGVDRSPGRAYGAPAATVRRRARS